MALIFESKDILVDAFPTPHVDRDDGGHIIIKPKIRIGDRQDLSPAQAIELMRLTLVVGKAMKTVLNDHGVDVGRINYQDNGNWSVFKPEGPYLHVHLYGRAKSAKAQPYGAALRMPFRSEEPEFYKDFKPLTEEDVAGIREEIVTLLSKEKYSDETWGLKE